MNASGKGLFMASIIAGTAVWGAFAVFKTEPWDVPLGWIVLAGVGFIFGLLAKGNPILWPLGILLGEVLFGLGSLVKSLFFYSGGGVNFFLPLGLMFLVPFTVPALIGSFAGFGLRKAIDARKQPTGEGRR